MTKDKTVTMSRELAERLIKGDASKGANALQLSDAWKAMDELSALLAAPVVERQDNPALMKIAAGLANRHPLRQLYLVCEHQGRINTDSLHEHLDKCGDLLAGIALDIRRADTSPPAPVAMVLPERAAARPREGYWTGYNDGWNACLDKVKEMNKFVVSAEQFEAIEKLIKDNPAEDNKALQELIARKPRWS